MPVILQYVHGPLCQHSHPTGKHALPLTPDTVAVIAGVENCRQEVVAQQLVGNTRQARTKLSAGPNLVILSFTLAQGILSPTKGH